MLYIPFQAEAKIEYLCLQDPPGKNSRNLSFFFNNLKLLIKLDFSSQHCQEIYDCRTSSTSAFASTNVSHCDCWHLDATGHCWEETTWEQNLNWSFGIPGENGGKLSGDVYHKVKSNVLWLSSESWSPKTSRDQQSTFHTHARLPVFDLTRRATL